MQAYTDGSRENDPHALPDMLVEYYEDAFFVDDEFYPDGNAALVCAQQSGAACEIKSASGYYACICFPGCLPDSDWTGPFDSEEEAISAMRDMYAPE